MHSQLRDPGYSVEHIARPSTRREANLISSETISGMHAPVIDLDIPCRLIPSGTPGHFHLYIDVEMEKEVMLDLLDAMVKAGVVEKNFAAMSRAKGAAYVRPPEKPKGHPDSVVFKDDRGRDTY